MKQIVIAHRGASSTELENSLAAFRAAAPQGADAVELDVHATADGELIVHHDETIGTVAIAQSPARAIAALQLANGEPVPTLSQALAAIGPALQVFVEVKTLDARWDAQLLEALDRGPNPQGYAVHSFDVAIIRRFARRRPAMRRGVFEFKDLKETGASVLWLDQSKTDEALVRRGRGAGATVFVWTVDDPDDMNRFMKWGVDGICTNVPERARRIMDAHHAA